MKLTRKQIIISIVASFVLGAAALVVGFFALVGWAMSGDTRTPFNVPSAVASTLKWGRLAPLPSSAREFTITTEGSMFTRAFRASFVAPADEIEEWLRQSPGTRGLLWTVPSPALRHFEIAPGGGAQHAEITVDDNQQRVSIYVYWS